MILASLGKVDEVRLSKEETQIDVVKIYSQDMADEEHKSKQIAYEKRLFRVQTCPKCQVEMQRLPSMQWRGSVKLARYRCFQCGSEFDIM